MEKKIWHWVLGDTKKGFKVVIKRPKTKFVPEPFETRIAAERWIGLQYLESV